MNTERSEPRNSDPDGWEPVPAGMLSHVARRRRAAVRMQRAGVGGVSILLLIGVGLLANGPWRSAQSRTIAGISCDEVQQLLPLMAQDRPISAEKQAQVEAHLTECRHCCELWEQTRPHSAAAWRWSGQRMLVARQALDDAPNW